MMHIIVTKPLEPFVPIFFNIEEAVGKGCANAITEDVMLVQFMFRKLGEIDPMSGIGKVYMKVPVTGICDDLTINAITAAQEFLKTTLPGTVVDGKVSHAIGVAYRTGVWSIVKMNQSLRKHYPQLWPRLQDFTDCPSLLKTRIAQIL